MIEDLWYSIRYWVEDNLQIVLAGLLLVAFIGLMVFLKINDGKEDTGRLVEGVKKNSLEEVEAVKELTGEVDDVFSLLDERRVGVREEYPAYEIDLFLKKPFIQEKDFEEVLEQYVDIYKWKENETLSGMKIRVYDRKEVFDRGLEPRATVYYFKKIDTKKLLTEEEGGERLYGDTVMGDNFQDTIDTEDKPSYKDYVLRIDDFKPLETKKNITPLTDQEFSFYLKMEMYKTILGGNKYGGAKLYLQWDLGKDVYRDGIVAIEREFENFFKRHLEIGGQVTYFDNEYVLKQELAIEKPQFLLFALTNKKVDDPLDAQKELIKEDPDLFKEILEEHINEQVEEYEENTKEDEEVEEEKETNTEDEEVEGSDNDEEYHEFTGDGS